MKQRLTAILKRYQVFFLLLAANLLLLFFMPAVGRKSFSITWDNLIGMLSVIPPIFMLLGLLDIWVKKETLMKYMGKDSGLLGVLIGFALGAAAAGPLYAAFPVAGILLKKGSKVSNVLIFIGAWSTMKIPLLLFESNALGGRFTLLRLGLSILGVLAISVAIHRLLSDEERAALYRLADTL